MMKNDIIKTFKPVIWLAERWYLLSILMAVSMIMFYVNKLMGILTVVFGLIHFIYRYILWDFIEQYFEL